MTQAQLQRSSHVGKAREERVLCLPIGAKLLSPSQRHISEFHRYTQRLYHTLWLSGIQAPPLNLSYALPLQSAIRKNKQHEVINSSEFSSTLMDTNDNNGHRSQQHPDERRETLATKESGQNVERATRSRADHSFFPLSVAPKQTGRKVFLRKKKKEQKNTHCCF